VRKNEKQGMEKTGFIFTEHGVLYEKQHEIAVEMQIPHVFVNISNIFFIDTNIVMLYYKRVEWW